MALVPYVDKKNGKARPGPRSYPEPPPEWVRNENKRDGDKGRLDISYRDPETNTLFRSKKSVWENIRKEIWDFDFQDVPEQVSFVLDNSENKWSVYEGDKRVSEEEVKVWEKASKFVSDWDNFGGSTSTGAGDKKRKSHAQEQPEKDNPTINVHIEFKPII